MISCVCLVTSNYYSARVWPVWVNPHQPKICSGGGWVAWCGKKGGGGRQLGVTGLVYVALAI